jgi:glycerol-3-phosphate dehydrogenase (NAD(P)+)
MLAEIKPAWIAGKYLAASINGFVPDTGLTAARFISHYFNTEQPVIVIAGPSHAEEIAIQSSTFITVAGKDNFLLDQIDKLLTVPYIHVFKNNDPNGVAYASVLKDIIGIAAGIAHGLNYGASFQAVLISNAMHELETFLARVEPLKRRLQDSAYFGDVLVTAYSDYSRSRSLGKLIGRSMYISDGPEPAAAMADGFYASKELLSCAATLGLEMPVTRRIYRILHQNAHPYHEFKLLEKILR